MTDKSYVLGKGRLHFDGGLGPRHPPSPHLGYRWTGQITGQALGELRVFFICGYHPQRLLASPERLAREWREGMMRLFDFPPEWLNEDLFVRPYVGLKLPMLSPEDEIRLQPAITSAMFSAYIDTDERVPIETTHMRAVIVVNHGSPWRGSLSAALGDDRVKSIHLDMGQAPDTLVFHEGYDFSAMLKRDALRTEKARGRGHSRTT